MRPASTILLAALAALVVVSTAEAQVVAVEPPPPVVVIYQPQPQPQPAVRVQLVAARPVPRVRETRWGLHGELGAMVFRKIAMGGGSLAVRLRPIRRLAVDLGMGHYRGVGYHGEERSEIPMTVNALFFVNPQDRLQLYVLGGAGVSFVAADMRWRYPPGTMFVDYTTEFSVVVGGQLGVGLEWRVARHFAINTDLRGFIRSRVDDSTIPDYVDPDTGATTNTSGGIYWTGGATLYW